MKQPKGNMFHIFKSPYTWRLVRDFAPQCFWGLLILVIIDIAQTEVPPFRAGPSNGMCAMISGIEAVRMAFVREQGENELFERVNRNPQDANIREARGGLCYKLYKLRYDSVV